ncbi:hypothetical protein T439DRAFT_308655 [Meredithblackwellia eburnea MCA 4105]
MPPLAETAPASSTCNRVFPKGAWDTHHHIFDLDKFPLAPTRHFTPDSAPLRSLEHFHHQLGIDHAGLAHGLSFGWDISSLEYYLDYFQGTSSAYGVIDLPNVTDKELHRLDEKGLRGIRIDFHFHKCQHDVELQKKWLKAYTERVKIVDWGVQVYSPHPEFFSELTPIILESPVPIVLDHFGGLRTATFHRLIAPDDPNTFDVLNQPGLAAIKALLTSGKLYLKFSAPYRVSEDRSYDDMEALVKDLVKANPRQILYGSDWPHTQPFHRRAKHISIDETEKFVDFDDRKWVLQLKEWLTEDEWFAMLVENPRRLFKYTRDD